MSLDEMQARCDAATEVPDDEVRAFLTFAAHARADMPRLIAALRVAMAGLNGLAALGGGRSEGNCDAQHALARVTAILEGSS